MKWAAAAGAILAAISTFFIGLAVGVQRGRGVEEQEGPLGVWQVQEGQTLTPQMLERSNDLLTEALARRQTIVVVDGITFTWKPFPAPTPEDDR